MSEAAGAQELRPGLWHWAARHPEWTAEDDVAGHVWGPEVSSYAIESGDQLVLIDPVVPIGGLDELLSDRQAVAVLTCPWHARDSLQLEVPVYAPASGAERLEGAIDYGAGEPLPLGITALPGLEAVDLVLWIASHGALVFGDTLVDLGSGLELPEDWGPPGVSHPGVLASLRRCLELPVELVLPTHGLPADRAALERALS